LRRTFRIALRVLGTLGAVVVLLVLWLLPRTTSWPPIADAATLARDCEALAADFWAGRVPDASGRRRGDPGWGNRVAPRDWPESVRALNPQPHFVRVDAEDVTIFQSAGAFGGWGVVVCLADTPCADGLVATDHPRVFHFETDH